MTTKENHEKALSDFHPIIQNYLNAIVQEAEFLGRKIIYLADYTDMGGYCQNDWSEIDFEGRNKIIDEEDWYNEDGNETEKDDNAISRDELYDAKYKYKEKVKAINKNEALFINIID
jgi:hypothetical protein